MMDKLSMMSPILQYGFGGFSFVLLGILVWLIRKMLKSSDANTAVIARNTEVFQMLGTEIRHDMDEVKTALKECRDAIVLHKGAK